jgi:regulator of protease activity HflC (stomatin/prohibitin superfamily)
MSPHINLRIDDTPIERFTMHTMHIPLIKWTVGILAALVLTTVLAPFAVVPAGSRGVMTTMGKPSDDVFTEGIHFRIPIVQQMHLMDVRISKSEGEGDAASKDLQQVRVKVAVNYHLDPATVAKTFRDVGQTTDDVVARILDPARPEAFKAVTALFTAEELITKRTQVREQIAALLREKMTRHGLILDEFAIVNFAFSPSFTAAIEAKVNAEQANLKAERDLMRIRVEAEQKVASAKAEAESLRLQRQEVTPDVLALRTIEKWDGHLPQVTGGAIPLMDFSKLTRNAMVAAAPPSR